MSEKLPKYVIIQSGINNRYLRLNSDNPKLPEAVRFVGNYSFGIDTRFEVVQATIGTGHVHFRCLANNKYLECFHGHSGNWIVATADKPVENQTDERCTLFQPVFLDSSNNSVLRLLHVKTNTFIEFFPGGGLDSALVALKTGDDMNTDVFTFIDWGSVPVLPSIIRIKGDNGNHLMALGDGYMDYNSKADASSKFDFEVSPSRDGGIRLKSVYYNKYWTDMDDSEWVLLKDAASTVHETNTVFLPKVVAAKRITLRCLKNGLYCKRFTDRKTNCLATLLDRSDKWSDMYIEESVVSRTIENVIYHFDAARRYDEKAYALQNDEVNHRAPFKADQQLYLKKTVANTHRWSAGGTETDAEKSTFGEGVQVPVFSFSGGFEVSDESTKSHSHDTENTENLEVGSVKTITMEKAGRVRGTLMGTRLKFEIPYSYTARDVLSDGTIRLTKMNDGLFSGVNGYGYRYEIVELPLNEGSP